jgi:hypothetical protein
MPIEHDLGTLIRRMNPYTNGRPGSMLFGSVGLPPVLAPNAAAARATTIAAAAAAAAAHAAADAAQAPHNGAPPGDAFACAHAAADVAETAAKHARLAADAVRAAHKGDLPVAGRAAVDDADKAAGAATDAAVHARSAADEARTAHNGAAPADARDAVARARAAANAAIAKAEEAANFADPLIDLAHIDLVVDDLKANYSSADWVFRGQPQTVKRALQITYRYQLMDEQRQPIPGVYATEHILVGYAGGNGSG